MKRGLFIKKKIVLKFIALLVMLLIVQVGFYFIQLSYEKSLVLAIQSLANQESMASDSYLLSRELQNLESINLFKCSKIINKKSKMVIVDYSFHNDCETSFFKLNGRAISTNINAINGDIWEIQLVSNNSSEFQLLLWVVRFLVCTLGFLFLKIHEWRINQKNLEIAKQELKIESASLIAKIASQVSHDIRSPLLALKMAFGELDFVPSEQQSMIRNSIQRINDIANNLLNINKGYTSIKSASEELIFPVLDYLVSEKRMQYLHYSQLKIEIDFRVDHRFFVNINKTEFHRVISNLINNSVEAMLNEGIVTIRVSENDEKTLVIEIIDTGKGIPKHVLEKLGKRGFSHGKIGNDSGSGLGIYHAKETIESFNGRFEIQSTEGAGTCVMIVLPKAQAPSWFAGEIIIPSNKKLFVLDDDENIFQMWQKKIGMNVSYYSSGEEFSKRILGEEDRSFLCLIDYELNGQAQMGLDLIESLHLSQSSLLVTSHYDEKDIRERCQTLGVRIIPKSLIEWISISSGNSNNEIFDCVYIDNDYLLRVGWQKRAKRKNIKLLVLKSSSEFKQFSEQISKESTAIYIDSDLGVGEIRGEEFAKYLHGEGYQKLFISSGYEAINFAHLPWLGYIGKECPF